MKLPVLIGIVLSFYACNNKKPELNSSTELIHSAQEQKILFDKLKQVFFKDSLPQSLNDSMAFLILPLQASCPSCRKKTIDSIMAHLTDFRKNQYITIALDGGSKSANSFFKEQKYELPKLTRFFQFDSLNQTFRTKLYENQPMLYYAANQKVFKKVAARPSTVREDLREFFTGYRKDTNKNNL